MDAAMACVHLAGGWELPAPPATASAASIAGGDGAGSRADGPGSRAGGPGSRAEAELSDADADFELTQPYADPYAEMGGGCTTEEERSDEEVMRSLGVIR